MKVNTLDRLLGRQLGLFPLGIFFVAAVGLASEGSLAAALPIEDEAVVGTSIDSSVQTDISRAADFVDGEGSSLPMLESLSGTRLVRQANVSPRFQAEVLEAVQNFEAHPEVDSILLWREGGMVEGHNMTIKAVYLERTKYEGIFNKVYVVYDKSSHDYVTDRLEVIRF